ncbi:hypothetical protein BXZ70DRAFT_1005807 [Cristinia sonorae]|uniref:F-box domain-containing protein n=1 Tax=Cristinia sonorae TaxID=1940300 RepID=A0A8K0XS90_9AGAR|nr:hypothetical protein BXZ70DRAFT_1005807 [Cristinia sonorae]
MSVPVVALVTLPEELLDRILSELFFSTPSPDRPAWHTPTANFSAPLLTCKLIHRVSAPLLYRNVTLRSPTQSALFGATLLANPELAQCVWNLTLGGVWEDGMIDVLSSCSALRSLDMMLDEGWKVKEWVSGQRPDGSRASGSFLSRGINAVEVLAFCDALGHVKDLRRLTIRKSNNTYLTQLVPATILQCIGTHVQRWTSLEHVEIAFRYSSAQSLEPLNVRSAPELGEMSDVEPVISLSAALGKSPRLRSVTTMMPAVWNDALLEISVNQSLQKIHLVTAPSSPGSPAPLQLILPSALWFKEASNHPRLVELINAGSQVLALGAVPPATPISARGRAMTVNSPPSTSATKHADIEQDEILEAEREREISPCPASSSLTVGNWREGSRGKIGMRRSSAV